MLVESVPKVGLPADRGSSAADFLLRVSLDMFPANWRLANVSDDALSFWVTFGSLLGHTQADDL